ncbi:MAG TPA: hypothetical protein PKD79_02145 [Candidatus Doudnabacteria bacterium]|nr:hypothetical protein [Candidatus Doudnabacteria bacterium]
MKSSAFSPKTIYTILLVVLALDVLMVVLHLSLGQQYNLVNIDLERNLPTLYQVFKLITITSIVAAIIALLHYSGRLTKQAKWLLWPYWFGFAYIGLDELGEIHERFGDAIKYSEGWLGSYGQLWANLGFTSAWWLAFFTPIFVVGLFYVWHLIKWLHKQQTGKIHWLMIGIACFGLVIGVELWNTAEFSYEYTFLQRNLLVTLEEFLELLGASFLLIFNLFLYRHFEKTKLTRK